jgi:hypothetical protein
MKEQYEESRMRSGLPNQAGTSGQRSDGSEGLLEKQPIQGWRELSNGKISQDSGNSSQEVSISLMKLSESMRNERISLKAYRGDKWHIDGRSLLNETTKARQAFDKALDGFVETLTNA